MLLLYPLKNQIETHVQGMKKLKHAVNQQITLYVKKSLFTAMIIMISRI